MVTYPSEPPISSRDRIITEALRLFGEQGYAKTSIAQIEQAAGLSGGSGALYRHFKSKDELLVQAVGTRLVDRGEWDRFMAPEFSLAAVLDTITPGGDLVDKLVALCRIGLTRLDHDRDVTRILLRDNSIPAALLEVFREQEYAVVMAAVTKGLRELAGPHALDQDWDATAAVLVGALAHFWMMRDIFDGGHPADVDTDRYLIATAQMTAARLDWAGTEGEDRR
ncbi:TetR/AcrR family transcriptional regulator [Nocardia asteroides]|uniref:TetR/AcrR family transcriptional regulator n=1 Tax=Nocardia asteroides TaxID=1824 RepID=UPI001E3978F2|nr:TetR/AcrR family transcriptional regulator [Nocardia asteroides]UGT57690.1 TetR/AcrR family transcriptional regulator [Nocardia asteroides]